MPGPRRGKRAADDGQKTPAGLGYGTQRDTRMTMVRGIIDGLTDDELERGCPLAPALGSPERTYTLGRCLNVIMHEECEHRRYAVPVGVSARRQAGQPARQARCR